MVVCGKEFDTKVLARIALAVKQEPALSRRTLSRRVCEWMDWRSPNGRWQEMSCRKALATLNRRGLLKLPTRELPASLCRRKRRPKAIPVVTIKGALSELGEVSVEPVSSRYAMASRVWFSLTDRYHYLGGAPACGARIRYLIKSSLHGVVGTMSFRSASWALKKRDDHIGWSEEARRANLKRVVCNDRFLILPTVEVKNLASRVLSLALKRLPGDWEQRYGVRPVLVETFVDTRRFRGTCYQAANWRKVGRTAGRRDGRTRAIYVCPLSPDWREVLVKEPVIVFGETPVVSSPAHWAEAELGTARLHDPRLKKRLYTIAQDFFANIETSLPESCGSKARTIGAYRFFQNRKVTMNVVLTAHAEATVHRIRDHRVVLAPQDTTTLNYATHLETEGLGPINNVADSAMGLILHDTLAFTEEGTPLGVLDAQCWARDADDRGKRVRRKQTPLEQKESMKWLRSFRRVAEIQKRCPETTLVSVGDRESDVYDLFVEALKDPLGPKLLVRSERSRNRRVDQTLLWDRMGREKIAGAVKIHIPRSGTRKARDAWVDIRWAQVSLTPPKTTGHPPVNVWAVYVREQEERGAAHEPVEWMLLTTAAVKNLADARKRVEWYAGRWGIELYHRVLKSGCRIQDRQLGTARRLEACLGVDMVVGWRVYHLAMLGRETPNAPCSIFFQDVEWKALCCFVHKTKTPPSAPPTLEQAVRMVGGIGGHLGRKGDGAPGTQTLWRGIQKLETATEMYALLTNQVYAPMFQTGP